MYLLLWVVRVHFCVRVVCVFVLCVREHVCVFLTVCGVYVWCMYLLLWVYAHLCMGVYGGQRLTSDIFPQSASTSIF